MFQPIPQRLYPSDYPVPKHIIRTYILIMTLFFVLPRSPSPFPVILDSHAIHVISIYDGYVVLSLSKILASIGCLQC